MCPKDAPWCLSDALRCSWDVPPGCARCPRDALQGCAPRMRSTAPGYAPWMCLWDVPPIVPRCPWDLSHSPRMHPVSKLCTDRAVPPGYARCPHRVPPGCAPCPQDATLGCALCTLRAPCAPPCPPCAHGMHPPSSITQEGWAQGAYQRRAPWMHPWDTTCTSTMCLSEHPWMCPVPSCAAQRVPYAPGCALHPTVHPRMLSGSPL